MGLIEITRFSLVEGADEDGFLAADRQVQTETVPNRRGFVRRTTARSSSGEWAVVTIWGSGAAADEAAADIAEHRATMDLMSYVDATSIDSRRYETLA